MPNYDFQCDKCGATEEVILPLDKRDDDRYCSDCFGGRMIRIIGAPYTSYEGAMTPIKRAGSGWNDVLKGIKKASGRSSNIEHY